MSSNSDTESHLAPNARRNLLYARLITLMQLADDSAEIAYPRRLHMPNISRQLIFMIGLYGQASSKELAAASGREKAQISRSVKALADEGLIERSETRRSITLSASGQDAFADVMKIARERDTVLRAGLSEADVTRFLDINATLIDRASSIFLADELTGPINPDQRSSLHHPPEAGLELARSNMDESSFRDLVLPWLQSLMTYMRRSGTTLFRREVGLSGFEWRILSLIAETQPVNLSSLISLVSRDKSQVARMVKQLHAVGLIDRHDEGRVNAALVINPSGRAVYEKIHAISVERDGFLFETRSSEDRAFYFRILEKLTANAGKLLDDEMAARSDNRKATPSSAAAPAKSHARGRSQPAIGQQTEMDALRAENERLKKLLVDAMLEISVLKEHPRQDA